MHGSTLIMFMFLIMMRSEGKWFSSYYMHDYLLMRLNKQLS